MTNFISQMRCYAPPQFNRLWLPNNSNCPLLSSPSHQRGECALPGLEMYVRTSACVCEPVSGRESALRPVSSMLGIVLNLCASSVICIVEYQWPPPHAPSPRDARTRSQTARAVPRRRATARPRRSAMWRSGSQCASVFIRNKLRHCQLYILRYYGTVSHLKISSHIGIGGVQSLRTSRSSPCSRLSSVRVPCAAPAAHIRSPVHRDRAPRAVGVVAHS